MIIHGTNLHSTISFFTLDKKRLKYILHNENDNYSCNTANTHMMQCKHMISFSKLFNWRKNGKYWYKRNRITRSQNIGTYISSILK